MGLIVDNFAGGGGASTGIEMALRRPVDIAINHDPEALAMHAANHPHTRHFVEDVWAVDPREVTRGEPVDLAWFSPDCTHFSKSRGGKPKDKKIRGLAWVAVKWAQQVRPSVICLENVEEFVTWGPLDDFGQPVKAQAGETFDIFIGALRGLGYEVDFRELRACDYGAPTTRKRFFLIARCDGEPIVWPERTHGMGKLPYRTAGECIDWTIPCPSIFNREKPLAENTLRRIAKGVVKYVLNNPRPFVVCLNHTAGYYRHFRGQDLDVPLGTITQVPGFAVVAPHITKFRANSVGHGMDEPLHTITACSVGESNHMGGAAPLGLVSAFLAKHYGGVVGCPVDRPLGTVTGIDHHSLVACHLERQFGNSVGEPMDAPMGTVMPGGGGKTALVAASIVKNNFGEQPHQDVNAPLHTVTTQGNRFSLVAAFLSKYYGVGTGQELLSPMQTVTSRDRFGLVTVSIEGESYAVVDIGMRMLQPRELFLAQGFPDDYVIDPVVKGRRLPKSAQVRMVGNSVCPPIAAAIVRANVESVTRGVVHL